MDQGERAFKTADQSESKVGPNPVDIHVGLRVRLRRKFLGMSQETLAAAIDLTFQQVQKYERGANRISASKLHELGKALKVKVGYFFEGYDDAEEAANSDVSSEEHRIHEFLATTQGVELASAFPRINNPKHRRKILELVRALADD